ncbi:hypothetical protein YC2023_024919 [Brassica napus]
MMRSAILWDNICQPLDQRAIHATVLSLLSNFLTQSEVVFDVTMENGLDIQQTPTMVEHPPQIQEIPFSLLPYHQMIMEAIEASNDAKGCTKTAILKHIETTQTHLPPSHLTLLDYHLNQMKHSGKIVIVKNYYMKPDQKPKPQGDSSHVAVTSPSVSYSLRLRGRPPRTKSNDSFSGADLTEEKKEVLTPSVSGRPRGRTPKKEKMVAKTNGVDLQQTPTEEHPPQLQELPFSLPPYPRMIMEAIGTSNGCNKTAIVKHIESTQITLPPSHLTLLNYHLNRMKQSGQIVIVKNNYTKPDPNAPPKRGRGRPPKPKPEGENKGTTGRPRGRPP